MLLEPWGKFEAVVAGIIEHKSFCGGYPVFAARGFASFFVAPAAHQFVVESQVGELVVGADESRAEGGQYR